MGVDGVEVVKQKIAAENFFKEAFCVDGPVEVLPDTDGFVISSVVKLQDSRRGVFYVGRLTPEGK